MASLRFLAVLLPSLAALSAGGAALAHPHVWIDSKTDVIFDDAGRIVAIGHEWTMDEAYTNMAVDGLDADKDGSYSDEELAPLTRENLDSLKDFGYFTSLRAGGQDLAFTAPVEAGQRVVAGRAKLHFRLPLATPLDPRTPGIVLKVYDPEYFIAIDFAGESAVAALGSKPPQCSVTLEAASSDQATSDTRSMLATKGVDWQPDPNEDFGSLFARPIVVRCAGAAPAAAPPAAAAQPPTPDLSSRTLLPRRTDAGAVVVPSFWTDPAGNIAARQRIFYQRISATLQQMKAGNSLQAALALMLLSFGYGIFHAAGPGHGKTVISSWLLATEEQLKRGILVAFTSSIVQAGSAIAIVTAVLLLASAAGSTARSVAAVAEAASYGLVALLGFYLLFGGLRQLRSVVMRATAVPGGGSHHGHHHGHAPHVHDDACGHSHLPTARDVGGGWSLARLLSLSVAVGLRPCTGAILALLFAHAIGIYWAGVTATLVMALGTAITVSAIAAMAVFSRRFAMRLAGSGAMNRMNGVLIAIRLAAGALIAFLGATLFIGTLNGTAVGAF
ncbi:MAG TPA: DUF1007 family protein [Aestuariivirgaceae bacterium]|nr:DUF1007 family protein [Aestuariivirgaceae bacterium]